MKATLSRLHLRLRRFFIDLRARLRALRDRGRTRKEPIRPGQTLRLNAQANNGRLSSWPLLPPRRAFDLYLPASSPNPGPLPLLVWIHGCRQDAASFATGTRIREYADRRGIAVLMPHQTRLANPFRCWNWFDPSTAQGGGEVAIVLAQVELVCALQALDRSRIWIAGLSSGAALAASTALHAPQRFSALACHSGLAVGSAHSLREARAVMAGGAARDVRAVGAAARRAAGEGFSLPALIVQGEEDTTVAPGNADALVAQTLVFNGADAGDTLPGPDLERRHDIGTRTVREADWWLNGRLAVRRTNISGLGHAWSGGDASQAWFDAEPPDATALILDFFSSYGRRRATGHEPFARTRENETTNGQ